MKRLVLFLAAVFLSGCVMDQPRQLSGGLSIEQFYTDSPTAISGEPLGIFLIVRNDGGFLAENVRAELSYINLNDWQGTKKLELGDVAVDVGGHRPRASGEWELYAPDIPEGVSHDYDVGVEVSYGYHSAARVDMIVTRRGLLGSDAPSVEYTNGPIALSVSVDRDKITPDSKFVITVDIRNPGTGFPKDGSIKMNVEPSGNFKMDCPEIDEGNNNIELVEGSSTLYCKGEASDVDGIGSYSVLFDASYTYIETERITVSVIGEGEGRTGDGDDERDPSECGDFTLDRGESNSVSCRKKVSKRAVISVQDFERDGSKKAAVSVNGNTHVMEQGDSLAIDTDSDGEDDINIRLTEIFVGENKNTGEWIEWAEFDANCIEDGYECWG